MPSLVGIALTAHLLLESPASLNFILRPSSTLQTPQPAAHAVIRQYGLLLFVVNVIIGLILTHITNTEGSSFNIWEYGKGGERDVFAGQVAGALAIYHVGPSIRALSTIRRGHNQEALGGPTVFLALHVICGATLIAAFLKGHYGA